MAFFQEARPRREPFLNAPPIVFVVIAVLLGAHLVRILLPAALSNSLLVEYAFIPARYSTEFLARYGVNPGNWFDQALPFVTYMLLHGDWAHVIINCLWLLAFGPIVARRYGTVLFLLFFIICGVLAAATHLAFNSGATDPVIGASGAISGLMAAAIRMLRPLPGLASSPEGRLAPILSTQVMVFIAFWVFVNVVAGVTGLGAGGGQLHLIAWQAHLGGFAAGLLLSGPFNALRGLMARRNTAQP